MINVVVNDYPEEGSTTTMPIQEYAKRTLATVKCANIIITGLRESIRDSKINIDQVTPIDTNNSRFEDYLESSFGICAVMKKVYDEFIADGLVLSVEKVTTKDGRTGFAIALDKFETKEK